MSAHDRMMATATARAQEISALPPEAREQRYTTLKAEHRAHAGALGVPEDAAEELVDEMEQTIRGLVQTIEGGP